MKNGVLSNFDFPSRSRAQTNVSAMILMQVQSLAIRVAEGYCDCSIAGNRFAQQSLTVEEEPGAEARSVWSRSQGPEGPCSFPKANFGLIPGAVLGLTQK
jgi:hypothetical protein